MGCLITFIQTQRRPQRAFPKLIFLLLDSEAGIEKYLGIRFLIFTLNKYFSVKLRPLLFTIYI